MRITELVAEEVRDGRIDRLHELEDDLVLLSIKLLADDGTARRAARSAAGGATGSRRRQLGR